MLFVYVVGIEDGFADVLAVDPAVETALVAGVTRAARLLDEVQQRVGIAVDADFSDLLGVAAGRALLPEFIAAAGVVMRATRLQRLFESFGGDVGEHEYVLRVGILGDRRDEAGVAEINVDLVGH